MLKSLFIVVPLALAGCPTGVSIAPKATDFRPLPPEFRRECQPPVKLPEVELPQSQIEDYWGTDRNRLRACRRRHAATVRHWDKVTGEKPK